MKSNKTSKKNIEYLNYEIFVPEGAQFQLTYVVLSRNTVKRKTLLVHDLQTSKVNPVKLKKLKKKKVVKSLEKRNNRTKTKYKKLSKAKKNKIDSEEEPEKIKESILMKHARL